MNKRNTFRAFVWPVYFVAVFVLGLWFLIGRNVVGLADKWFEFSLNGKAKIA